MIRAECHSDDYRVEIEFDAQRWFDEATDEEILALARIGWGGDYEADAVAEEFKERETKKLWDYLELGLNMPYSNDPVGFECYVEESDALDYVKKARPHLLERL